MRKFVGCIVINMVSLLLMVIGLLVMIFLIGCVVFIDLVFLVVGDCVIVV